MRAFRQILGAVAVVILGLPIMAQAQDLIPDRRFVLSQDIDLPGGDIAQMFDTTLEACQRACLSSQKCTAFTFNTRNGSCFPKANPGEGAFFQGAFSGTVLTADPGAEARALARRGELVFLQDYDIASATQQATNLANEHVTDGWTAEEHLASAAEAEGSGDFDGASRFTGAAINITDAAENWADYARLLLAAAQNSTDAQQSFRDRSVWASMNAYLRADNKALQHTILVTMGDALEQVGRGRDKVQALRLAQSLQNRQDTATALDDAIGKYGFRIEENTVEADSARPRICATFSDDLVKSGVDYGTFVQLSDPGLTVTQNGRQLCVEGVQHGSRYVVTFREGLPAFDGQTLAKNIEIAQYVRDRSPGARFPGRGYVLPKAAESALPVETVNTDKLDLTLFRVTDRNLLRSVQGYFFGQPLQDYAEYDFAGTVGEEIWTGTATVGQEVNRDVTTRLPMTDALAGQPAGIYALKAAVPGVDPYVTGAAWQWFVVSDLGMTTMSGVDGLHVFVRSLGTAQAKSGITVELLNTANAVLGTAVTDDMGYAKFDAGLTRGTGGSAPAMVVAREGEADLAFLSLTDPEFDLSDRGVEGRQPAPPVDVFLTTDRGAYRAGETVYATALARDPQVAAIAGLPLTAVLYRPDGVEYARALVQDAGAGGYVFAMPIAGSAPRGVWTMDVVADEEAGALASQTFLVEDFLPERIDFDLTLADAPIRLGDAPDLTIDARYLFGAPGADLAIEGEAYVTAASGLEGFPGYSFGRYDETFDGVAQSFDGGIRTDDAGQAVIPLALPEIEDPLRPLEMVTAVRVAEGSGRPVERKLTRALTPSVDLIGVKNLFDYVVPEGDEAGFELIAVSPELKQTAMDVTWEVTRIETDYQWYQSFGSWSWEPVVTRTRVLDGTATLGANPVKIAAPVQWGEYELVVSQLGTETATSVSFYAGWYAPADVQDTPDTLELSLDKPAYAPGDTATLRIVPRAAGTALITVMSNRLVAMQAVEVKEGENLITLPVTDEWGAGVYVTASVLRPMDVAAGRNPARALGLSYAAVAPGARQLTVAVETAAEAAPRGPMEVAVKVNGVAAGDTAYVTIAAVDQGILNLTSFTPPDPSDHFFGQRKLGMGIRDVYGRLIDGLNGAQGTVRSGGDAGAQAQLSAPPPTEELVAYFSGAVQVGADGYARTTFTLPSFNGTVKIMAVAWSTKAVGQANADVLVRDPVVVTASLPRFMSPGDTSRLLLEIVHATGPSGRMGLDVTANGVTLGDVPSGFDLGDQAKAVFEVPVTAGAVGNQTITVALTTPDGKQLTKTLTIPVQVNDPEIARITRLDLAKGQSFTFDDNVFAGLVAGSGTSTMAIGPIARLNAPGILAALDRYPYGCTEQMTSKAMPLLYYDEIARVMNLEGADGIHERVQQAIGEILVNQSAEGAFGLWSPGSGDMWLDAFVTDFLSRAKAAGYDVPDQAFKSALTNLRNQVNYAPDFDGDVNGGGEAVAYALMVLAREGAAAVGDLRYYADVKGDAFKTPLAQAQVAAALASYGDQPRADAMFRKAAARLEERAVMDAALANIQIYRADYGTDYRDTAGVLTLAVEAGSDAVDREALADRIAGRSTGLSTQEATWALLAANALIDRRGADGITINGAAADGPLVRVLNAGGVTPVVVGNDGADTTVTVTTYGVPSEPEPAGGNGYAITRSYYTLTGEPVDVASVKVGTRLVTVLEVTPFERGEARLMVADPLPAGFEIDNPRLISAGDTSTLDWLTTELNVSNSEFRQDRFLTAIDRYDNTSFKLAYVVRAISPGVFHHPAASVEDMYRPDYRARTDAGQITITE
jgi:alpha-2-macroglobulin